MDKPEPTSEVTARGKFHCPACGAEAVWNPARQAMICGFCGTASPATLDQQTGEVREHDLVAALRGITDDRRGWAGERISVRCQSCRAISVFDPKRVAQNCEFCGSAQLVKYEEAKESFRPESLLPFKVSEPQARDKVRTWYGKVWFAPNALKKRALTDTVRGVYLPYWTFDAQVEADWAAEAGYHYYVTETYRDSSGNTQTRQIQKTRWQPASGHLSHFFDDELVCGSVGIHPGLLRAVEPFPTNDLKVYDPGYVAGWVVERYQIDLVDAAQRSRAQMEGQTRSMCGGQVPGDTYRNLEVRARYANQTFKHILAPIWMLSYTYGPKSFQVVINGYTGSISGEYPKSWIKITLAVLAVVVVVLIMLSIGGKR